MKAYWGCDFTEFTQPTCKYAGLHAGLGFNQSQHSGASAVEEESWLFFLGLFRFCVLVSYCHIALDTSFFVGAAPCTVGYLVASLVSTHGMTVVVFHPPL